MTGNTKIWRAPLAGLASVAMLATMGVATATANASTSLTTNDGSIAEANYSLTGAKVNLKGVIFPGETYADAYARNDGSHNLPAAFNAYGEYTVDGEPFDLYRDPVTADTKVTFEKASNATVPVSFVDGAGIDVDTAFILPFGNSFNVPATGTLNSQAVPIDLADGKVVTEWNVTYTYTNGDSPETVPTADLTTVDFSNCESISIAPKTVKDAKTVSFTYVDRDSSVVAHLAGSYLDTVNPDGTDLKTDVVYGDSVTVPTTVVSKAATTYNKLDGGDLGNNTDLSAAEGTTVTVGTNDTDKTFDYTKANTTLMDRVYFVDPVDGNKILQVLEVVDGGHVKASDVNTPQKNGYTFNTWYLNYSGTKFSNDLALTAGGYDFGSYTVSGSSVVYAEFVATTAITVTFTAGEFDGAEADKVVKYAPNARVQKSDAPAYTRAGYVLVGWTTTQDGTTADFDFTQLAGEVNGGKSFMLYAVWARVDANVAQAALEYINPDMYVTAAGEVTATESGNTAMGDFFTAASWAEYEDAYDAAKLKYDSVDYGESITAEVSAEVVSDLKAAWEKLVFKHTSGANVLAGVTVHRLSKGSDHFYTQDTAELLYMTAVEGWTDEGRLFDASDKDGAEYFASFDNIRKTDGTTSFSDQVIDQLAEAADEIVEPVYRAYNKVTGDHVWTVDANEYASLEAQKDWNAESAAFYTPTFTGTTDVMRLYKSSAHLMSTDANEVKVLSTKMGWTDEGVAFKAY